MPWEKIFIELIVPYQFTRKNETKVQLWTTTVIDPATGWFKIKEIKTKKADVKVNVVEKTWITIYN